MTGGMTLGAAYAFCREVARREAKNFYWSFRVLPRAKSDAMCAVYAFMRRADDIADDESRTVEEKRAEMTAWLGAWRSARLASDGGDPVFLALRDTQRRFGIADELLEDLVRGTSMDLEEQAPGAVVIAVSTITEAGKTRRTLQGFDTFASLYRYCYLVASVVGLTSIKVFGYHDARAEQLAEYTGIAFQLTNILRDVKEDAERGRIYLPQDMLAEHGISNEDVLMLARGRTPGENHRAMVKELSSKAWEYYASATELLPMIDVDSRAALWVMVEIYSRLLKRVDALKGDVFSQRARVPTAEKLLVLVQGAAMAVRARLG